MLLLLTMFYSLNPCRYGPFATDIQLSVPNYTTVGAVGCQAVSPLWELFANEDLTILCYDMKCQLCSWLLILDLHCFSPSLRSRRKYLYLISSFVYWQVSIFVVPDYKPPLAACVMNEVLELISVESTSTVRVLTVPFITRSSSYHHGMEHATNASPVLHGAEIGATTDFTHLLVDGTTKPPTSLQIRSEPILCLLEMVRVLKMPTVLVTSGGQQQGKSSTVSDLEVILSTLLILIELFLTGI